MQVFFLRREDFWFGLSIVQFSTLWCLWEAGGVPNVHDVIRVWNVIDEIEHTGMLNTRWFVVVCYLQVRILVYVVSYVWADDDCAFLSTADAFKLVQMWVDFVRDMKLR